MTFFSKPAITIESITQPLSKILFDLETFISKELESITFMHEEIKRIGKDIDTSTTGVAKANKIASNLSKILG